MLTLLLSNFTYLLASKTNKYSKHMAPSVRGRHCPCRLQNPPKNLTSKSSPIWAILRPKGPKRSQNDAHTLIHLMVHVLWWFIWFIPFPPCYLYFHQHVFTNKVSLLLAETLFKLATRSCIHVYVEPDMSQNGRPWRGLWAFMGVSTTNGCRNFC